MTSAQELQSAYADMIGLAHHQCPTRPHMPLCDRAAQFAPFAALSGYDEMVTEEARLTESEIELSESERDLINGVISEIAARIKSGGHPAVSVTRFKPDPYKQGGRYETFRGVVRKIDAIEKKLIFYGSENIDDKRIPTIDIPIAHIIAIDL